MVEKWVHSITCIIFVSSPKSHCFKISAQIAWTNFLYFSLGSIPIWPTHEQKKEEMREIFKRTYPSTRCILDCTELYCQRPSSLSTQNSLHSHYKSHVTNKGLIDVSPSASITFISELYVGSNLAYRKRNFGLLGTVLWRIVVSP